MGLYLDGPKIGVASNAAPVTIKAPQGISRFVFFFETLSSGASAKCAITCMPVGGSTAQKVNSNVSLVPGAIVPLKIDGLAVESFTVTPSDLTSGKTLKTLLQPIAV